MIQQFYIPTKVLFGPGSIDQLGNEAKNLGTRAMIVTYPDIRRLGFLDIVLKDLESQGIETEIFEELEPNPRTTTVDRAAGIAREKKIDLVIGMGGGSGGLFGRDGSAGRCGVVLRGAWGGNGESRHQAQEDVDR